MKRGTFAIVVVCASVWCGLAWMHPQGKVRGGPAPTSVVPPRSTSPFAAVRGQAGFWRIAQSGDGVWWFVSPQNHTEFLDGVTTVQPLLRGRDSGAADFISRDWDRREDQGSLLKWGRATVARVQEMGFKSLGAWCNPVLHECGIPMTRDLNVWRWVGADVRLFSRQWSADAEAAIRAQVLPLRHNRDLVGYYLDNELDWDDPAVGARCYFDELPPDDPNRREVLGVIHQTWESVGEFNRDWNTRFADWSALERDRALPQGRGYERLQSLWLYHVARQYFRITCDLVRRYDPNHLILGCRYRGWAPPQVARAARGLTDAQSLNYYAADALLDGQTFRTLYQQSAQPLIISEYSFHALDGRSGDRDLAHFPALVATQQDRARGYKTMTQRLARVPYVIGADWFQWMDEPPSGRLGDGEDANMGVVDIHDEAYGLLCDAVRQTAPLLNPLHGGSGVAQNQSVWRRIPENQHAGPTLAGGPSDLLLK